MSALLAARVLAVLVGGGTFLFLFLYDSWRADNLFLVPDLVLSALLVGSAALPAGRARSSLLFAFGLGAGVLGTSVASYAVRGDLGAVSLLGVVACAVGAWLAARERVPAGPARPAPVG